MVDVSTKPVTARVARAAATVRFDASVLEALMDAGGPKGDAFVTARLVWAGRCLGTRGERQPPPSPPGSSGRDAV